MFVVQPAKHDHRNRAERNYCKFNGAAVQSMRNKMRLAGNVHTELDQNCAGRERQQNTGEHGEATGERHGRVVDFAPAWIVHKICAQTPVSPKRQRQQRCQQRAGKGSQEKVKRENHMV